MVYRNYHDDCDVDCTRLTAYVRIEGNWTRIGHYGSECHKFEPLDLKQEKEDIERKHRIALLKSELKNLGKANFSSSDLEF